MSLMTLDKVPMNTMVVVMKVDGKKAVRRRLMDMGILPDSEIFITKAAPLGDPIEITVKNAELTLRKEDAENVYVKTDAKN